MLHWAFVFLGITIIAALFGFGGIAGSAAGVAQLFFMLFLGIFLITLVRGLTDRRPSAPW